MAKMQKKVWVHQTKHEPSIKEKSILQKLVILV